MFVYNRNRVESDGRSDGAEIPEQETGVRRIRPATQKDGMSAGPVE